MEHLAGEAAQPLARVVQHFFPGRRVAAPQPFDQKAQLEFGSNLDGV